MKTPEEIKKGLEACGSDECHGHHTDCPYEDDLLCTMHICGDARAYIQQLEHRIGELTEKVAQLEAAQPKWISVEERLPENDDNYLVFTYDKNEAEIATYYGDGEWLTHDLTNLTRLVSHWMPIPSMPEPPKEEAYGTKGTAEVEPHVRPARGE